MRRRLFGSVAGAMVLALTLASVTYGASDHRRVQVRDACDGPSFNAAIGPGTCARREGVDFNTFVGQLLAQGQAPKWRFEPETTKLARGGTITAVNKGGEFHTFTEVAAFGGGCVDLINGLLGLSPVPECAQAPGILFARGIAPGGSLPAQTLSTGVHRFECLIHPWMRTTVTVE